MSSHRKGAGAVLAAGRQSVSRSVGPVPAGGDAPCLPQSANKGGSRLSGIFMNMCYSLGKKIQDN